MDFHADPTVSDHTSLVVTTFQTAGTLLIALLLRLLTGGIPGRFLRYWSLGWVCLAAALVSLNLSFLVVPQLPEAVAPWVQWPALTVYALFEYGFGFYLWAGCRAYATGARLRRADWWLFVPPGVFGVVAPAFLTDINVLFPFHAAVFGGFCFLAFFATVGFRPADRQTAVGLRLTQTAIVAITLLFWHYAFLLGWIVTRSSPPDLEYLHFSALYDDLVETLLGFGMVVLGTDSVRRELAAKNAELAEANRRLAEASAQLAVTARTDALTGLLNRRAFEAVLAERANGEFAGAVAVIDLNDLKRLNDGHGHAAGDAAIRLVARALGAQFRITDPVFRVGGDEFVVVLEGGRSADLAGRLEALDADLRSQRLPGVVGPVDLVVAWGMADFDAPAAFAEALARADSAMYAAKSRRKAAGVGSG